MQVIAGKGEQKASQALKEAAKVIHQSPHALQADMRIVGGTGGTPPEPIAGK